MTANAAVVDTNRVFSALIPKASAIRDTLLDPRLKFYAPDFLLSELHLHHQKLLKSSKLTETELRFYLNGIMGRIEFVPTDFISTASRQQAYDLCKDIDVKDTPFIALCIEMDLPLWTGDLKLKSGLRSKGFENFFNERI
jgi:predicted nucleic acid-binding protein